MNPTSNKIQLMRAIPAPPFDHSVAPMEPKPIPQEATTTGSLALRGMVLKAKRSLYERCEETWNRCYPDRRPWKEIGEQAQNEWLRVFEVFESLS